MPLSAAQLARKHTPLAIKRLAKIAKFGNDREAVIACVALLDRAWGRPAQEIKGLEGGPVTINIINYAGGEPETVRVIEQSAQPAMLLTEVTDELETESRAGATQDVDLPADSDPPAEE